jgi:hypothetical protein
VTKWSAGALPTGINMVCWRFSHDALCPHCRQVQEDSSHVLRCQSPDAINLWHSKIDQLHIWLLLKAWQANIVPTDIPNLQFNLPSAVFAQVFVDGNNSYMALYAWIGWRFRSSISNSSTKGVLVVVGLSH